MREPHERAEASLPARLAAVRAGFDPTAAATRTAALDDPDPQVRAAALAATVRAGTATERDAAWRGAAVDPAPAVRRRAAELAPRVDGADPGAVELVALSRDPDPLVAEAACWALGERADLADDAATEAEGALADAARTHDDPLVREAAVAALGARGARLDVILAACEDRPAIRRRAVLALAPFDGPEVRAALTRALDDRDWQVRQAAEDLLGVDAGLDPGSDPYDPDAPA